MRVKRLVKAFRAFRLVKRIFDFSTSGFLTEQPFISGRRALGALKLNESAVKIFF